MAQIQQVFLLIKNVSIFPAHLVLRLLQLSLARRGIVALTGTGGADFMAEYGGNGRRGATGGSTSLHGTEPLPMQGAVCPIVAGQLEWEPDIGVPV